MAGRALHRSRRRCGFCGRETQRVYEMNSRVGRYCVTDEQDSKSPPPLFLLDDSDGAPMDVDQPDDDDARRQSFKRKRISKNLDHQCHWYLEKNWTGLAHMQKWLSVCEIALARITERIRVLTWIMLILNKSTSVHCVKYPGRRLPGPGPSRSCVSPNPRFLRNLHDDSESSLAFNSYEAKT